MNIKESFSKIEVSKDIENNGNNIYFFNLWFT